MRIRKLSIVFVCLAVSLASCRKAHEPIEPQLNTAIHEQYLKMLPSPFPPLSQEELEEPWGREYQIGIGFANELDLYLALTSFKRAYFLAPKTATGRKLELQYDILLCYYFGQKYEDVVYTYETTGLRNIDATFPAAHDLLIILYDSYTHVGEPQKAEQMMQHLHTLFPGSSERLELSTDLKTANFEHLEKSEDPQIQELLQLYACNKKNVKQAQSLNAVLPGAGYLYLGQKQSALTAFLLNGLFIAAAVHFFNKGHTAAGIITTGFEVGWYFGGITGAKEEATFYNERLYESLATPYMHQKKLFPAFMLKYAF